MILLCYSPLIMIHHLWRLVSTTSSPMQQTLTQFPGATDDSVAVVSLIQMAEYLASSRPARSIILLFDDGEEDGLHGAHM